MRSIGATELVLFELLTLAVPLLVLVLLFFLVRRAVRDGVRDGVRDAMSQNGSLANREAEPSALRQGRVEAGGVSDHQR